MPNGKFIDARRAFDRSIELDSAFGPSYIHMPELALRAQDVEGAKRYIRAYLARNRDENRAAQTMEMTGRMLEFGMRGGEGLDSVLTPSALQIGGQAISGIVLLMDTAETGLRLMRVADSVVRNTPSMPGPIKQQVRGSLLSVLLSRGRLSEAAKYVDANTWPVAPELALLGVLRAERMDSLIAGALDGPPNLLWQIPTAYRWWAQRGDTVRLTRALAIMQRRPANASTQSELAAIRAHIALARRDTAGAIREFAAVSDSTCTVNFCYQYRLAKAQLLSSRRMDREAERLLEQDYVPPGIGNVLWQLERGRVFERLGRRSESVDAYAYVSAAWNRADSTLQPVVREAREALRRLSPDASKGP